MAAALCIALGFGLLIVVAQQSLRPIQEAGNTLNTQVARMLHPTPTILPDPVTIVHQVTALARLETMRYSLEKIIVAEEGQDFLKSLFGDRLLFIAHGSVIAGVDLGKLSSTDLGVRDGVLHVRLPEAEVFVVALDNEKSYVYDRQTGILTKGNQDLETLARQAAEEQIRQAAVDDDILEQARVNAEVFLLGFFHNLGFEQVEFVQATPGVEVSPSATP